MQLNSREMKAAQVYTWIGLIILCVGLISLMNWLQTEPFLATGVCPAGFTFFNDNRGDSFCCKGPVINKQCTASGKHTICGLAPNIPDPRTGQPLPTCVQLMKDMDPSSKLCPSNMPNYIAPGNSPNSWKNGGCSPGRPTGDGSVFPRAPGPICYISGASDIVNRMKDDAKFQNTPNGQPSCETLKLQETAKCPANMYTKYDKHMYVHCMQNNYKYDPNNNAPPFCYPDEIVAMLPDKTTGKLLGLEKAKKDCMSCSYYKKRFIDKDTTAKCENYRR